MRYRADRSTSFERSFQDHSLPFLCLELKTHSPPLASHALCLGVPIQRTSQLLEILTLHFNDVWPDVILGPADTGVGVEAAAMASPLRMF